MTNRMPRARAQSAVACIAAAATHAWMTAHPVTAAPLGVRFTRRARSDDYALVWWEFHPRSFTFW